MLATHLFAPHPVYLAECNTNINQYAVGALLHASLGLFVASTLLLQQMVLN